MTEFTPTSLVDAVTQLFELNNYKVEGPLKVHGAEVDLIATPLGDPFGRKVYIEATIEHVDNDKYGKDVGKLAMFAKLDPSAQTLIVSSTGFSLPVLERAKQTQIWAFTYDELFQKFEKFDPYVSRFTGSTEAAQKLRSLVDIYEEPHFEDSVGTEFATDYLTGWKDADDPQKRWIVVTGEYGTGKTALTQILLHRWLLEYKQNPRLPIPFRIELRSFVRQFDARSLLHHFLDGNGLSHIPIDFAERLVRSGRAVLLLDGYDEMAQYFNARERRQCLEALASLSAEGAKGILTSRPNYFTQSEELQVFEVLYASLKSSHYLSSGATIYLEQEAQIDRLLARFLDQFERTLRDLSPEQTTALVTRILGEDKAGLRVVLSVLGRVFRQAEAGTRSLSGKPVIVSYLLEVVEQLKAAGYRETEQSSLTEWQIYKVIVDQLMIRDLARSSEISPDNRRRFLQRLAIFLSKRDHDSISEDDFRDLVSSAFRREISRHTGEARNEAASRYFSDLRSSATLTRSMTSSGEGWRFSHNSLREYLVSEYMVTALLSGGAPSDRVRVSDAMRSFTRSIAKDTQERLLHGLVVTWASNAVDGWAKGQLLELLWDGLIDKLFADATDPSRTLLNRLINETKSYAGIELRKLSLSTAECPTDLGGSLFEAIVLSDIRLQGADLSGCSFAGSTLDNVDFTGARLADADFSSSTLFDVIFDDTTIVTGASFLKVAADSTCLIVEDIRTEGPVRIEGKYAIGYLRSRGAETDEVPDYYVVCHSINFPIVTKIIENLSKQTLHQRRGLEQRGAATSNVPFARGFIDFLLNRGMLAVPKARKDMVETTEMGRDVFQKFVASHAIDERLRPFFQ